MQSVTVSSSVGFNVCNKVLIMQMKGASVNGGNTISYGTITGYNNSGNYEFSVISNIVGNVITFVSPLTKPYTASDIVQLIKVPVYSNNININGALTCLPWNGTTGGVLAFETSGSVTFNNNINVNGLGFLGGGLLPGSFTCGGDTSNYSIPSPSAFGAKKGEGIFINPLNNLGKGKNANGGGGGNDINGGGAGGGNFGAGGNGGFFRSSITCPPNFTLFCGGMRGEQLTYSNIANKVFLGGGGGAGHQNNGVGTAGGNGGGIVMIKAATIFGNSNTIFAEGDDVPVANIDGAGGGGSGGSVLLDVTSFSSLNISVLGGDGGSDNAVASDAHGKGGGGGGGIIWTSGSQAGITAFLNGGAAGIFLSPSSPYFNTSFGALPGQVGGTLTALSFPGISIAALTPTVSSTGSLSCSNQSTQLSVAPNSLTNTILWSGPGIVGANNTATIVANAVGVYSVSITSTAICSIGTATFNLAGGFSPLTLTPSPSSVQTCSSSGPVILSVTGASNYTWGPAASLVPSTGSIVAASPSVTTTYTINGVTGVCSGSAIITVSVNATPTVIVANATPTICEGATATLSASGATSYTWNPGNLVGATVAVNPVSTTIYTVLGTNGSCTVASTTTIFVVPSPLILTAASPASVCQGFSTSILATGALTFTWQPGNLSGALVTVTPAISTIYTVSGTNALGCVGSSTALINVNPNPTITINPAPLTLCKGSSATLTASGAINYTWAPGAIVSSSLVINPAGSITYTVNGNNGTCSGSATVLVTVVANPTVTPSGTSTLICNGGTTTLSAIGATTYTWNPGALVGSSVPVSPTTTTVYTVTGTSGICTDTKTISITVNNGPIVTVVSNPTTICSASGNSATLTASGAVSYTWNPGAVVSSTLVITPTVTSTFSITGINALGCISTAALSYSVVPTPTLNVSASSTTICIGSSATLTASGASNYTWFPGGSTGTNVVVSPTVNTTYTVFGNTGACGSFKTFTLSVNPIPNINIIALPTSICKGASSVLLANGAGNYTWSPTGTSGNTLLITPSVTTTYTVTGSNIFGCTNTAVTLVTVNPTPTITTIASSTVACLGNSVTLTSSGALNYILNPGASTGSVVVVSPTINTTYTITGLNGFGCVGSNTVTINVNTDPVLTVSSSSSVACNGASLALSAMGATNYTWMPGSLTGSLVFATVTNTSGTYTVLGEAGGCFGTSTLTVLVIDCRSFIGVTKVASKPVLVNNSFYNVTFTITAVNASSLNVTNVLLNENLSIAFPYPSSFSVVSQPVITSQNSGLSVHPLFDGVSQISLTSPTTSTLLANKRDTLVFTVRIDPKGYFGPFKNSVIGFADVLNSITVSDSSNNGFAWDPDNDGDPTNNDTITIINLPPIDLFIPDGFTPNGDGKNDLFFIKGLNGRSIKLTIFNRWGNKVYEKSDYDNSWNGFVNATGLVLGNNKVPAATYYYIIEFLDGDKETRTGFVVVQY
ncbi:MAG: gliding motility-associated C-terminal domain-containing protein [Bacteroidetes bacterium]|nr:gliding motility-associated C-terminal domain-containing protein [Bacteroidota bacterium]